MALDCIIQASVKASVGTSVLQGGVEVLQQLFLSDDKEVRAKALVGLCKTGSAGKVQMQGKCKLKDLLIPATVPVDRQSLPKIDTNTQNIGILL